MSLSIIQTGLTKSAPTEYLAELKAVADTEKEKKLVVMVPDRFSYIAEKAVCRACGGLGIGNVWVVTFHQLCRTFLEGESALSSVGKQMLLKKIIRDTVTEENVFYVARDRQGFCESVLDIMNSWKRFSVKEEDIIKEIEGRELGTSEKKLIALGEIYKKYNENFEKLGATDEADELMLVSQKIKESEIFSDAHFWIEGYTEFSPSEREVISSIAEVAKETKVYLPSKSAYDDEDGAYRVIARTEEELASLCTDKGIEVSFFDAKNEKQINEQIAFFVDNYDNEEKYKGDECAFSFGTFGDIYEETESAAEKIIELVLDEGYKFSDISILCGGLGDYISCLEAIFNRYNIPYFVDFKLPLINHPISILLTSVFDMLFGGKKLMTENVIRYIKTGYVVDNSDDADSLCRFAEKHGIKGSMWANEKYFLSKKKGFFDEALGIEESENKKGEKFFEISKNMITPLLNYYEKSKGKKDIKEHISIFFEYLDKLKLFSKIQKHTQYFEELGDENEASRLTHVWNLLINIFDQMAISLDGEKVSRAEFGEYLLAGIEGSEISIIPTVTNGVSVSDTGHRSGMETKALIILGATKEALPPIGKEEGLFTEDEYAEYNSLPFGASLEYQNAFKEFEMLRAFSDITDRIYLNYSKTNINGDKLEKSPMLDTISEKLVNIAFEKKRDGISAPNVMLHKLLLKLAEGNALSAEYRYARDWFSEKRAEEFSLISEAEKFKAISGMIPKDISAKLYEGIKEYSVSRLEKYFNCPFSYFLNFGLSLEDDEEYGMKSTDTGSFVHFAIAEFCKRLNEESKAGANKWNTISEAECRGLVREIVDDMRSKTEADTKMDIILDRLEGTIFHSAVQTVNSIRCGNYSILDNEHWFEGFELKTNEGNALFHGIIDRIDVFEENGKKNIRIVDYKTGSKSCDLEKILNGLDLQLVIYAMAAKEQIGEVGEVSGLFYDSVKKTLVSADSEQIAKSEAIKGPVLNGYVLEEAEGSVCEVKNGADMDKNLITDRNSRILKLKLKKDGNYDAHSWVLSKGAFSLLSGNVRDMVIRASNNIASGDVRVYPYEKSKTESSCTYCPFSNICIYDLENGAKVNDGSLGKSALKELREMEV